MGNLDKLKTVWFHLDETYEKSGMTSKKEFLQRYLGYRDGVSGLPKLLTMLQKSCSFNDDHEPLPEFKEDYDSLNLILSNADKLLQSDCDIEGIDLDDLQSLVFDEEEQEDIAPPSFDKIVNNVSIMNAIVTKFSGGYYDARSKRHMVTACVNDDAAMLQNPHDCMSVVTYLTTKISCGKSTLFDQLMFRYLVKNYLSVNKCPTNLIFLDKSQVLLEGGHITLKINQQNIDGEYKVTRHKRTGDKISYREFKMEFPEYEIIETKNKQIFGKVFSIVCFNYEDVN